MKYLDLTGLGTFWTKVKNFVVGSHNWDNIGVESNLYKWDNEDYPGVGVMIANGGTSSIRLTRVDVAAINFKFEAGEENFYEEFMGDTYDTQSLTIGAGSYAWIRLGFSDDFNCNYLKIKITATFSSPDSRTVTKT